MSTNEAIPPSIPAPTPLPGADNTADFHGWFIAWPPNFHADPLDASLEGRRLFTEVLGTFVLVFIAAGGDVINAVTGGSISHSARAIAPALIVLALIYTLGDVSGAHLNPAVTFAFALRKDFAWRRVPGYMIAQFVGAILAALLLRLLFGNAGNLGANLPDAKYNPLVPLIMEVLLTAILVTVVLGTAHNARLIGANAAFGVAATIAVLALIGGPISGASMNPARSFGPALVGGNLGPMWIYLVGPAVGAALAAGVAWVLHGPTLPEVVQAATGAGG